MNHESTRRQFLKRSTEAAAITAAVSTLGGVHAIGAQKKDTISLGIIGCGGMMDGHVKGLVGRGDEVRIAWFCDVDPKQIARRAIHLKQSTTPKKTIDYEHVLEDKSVDAVIIATPHHWHAPIALNAMSEGKDVYIEKPISHVYDEGNLIIQAAKKYGRVVATGQSNAQ